MASDPQKTHHHHYHNNNNNKSRNQQLVSTMIKQGFIQLPPPPPPPNSTPTNPAQPQLQAQPNTDKLTELLSHFGPGDVSLTIADNANRVSLDVHRKVLTDKSRFFKDKLNKSGTHSVEILDCDDVDVYLQTLMLMYSSFDLLAKLLTMDFNTILSLLKICSAIMFDDAVNACLRYLDAVPWSEEQEEKVVLLLNQLQLDGGLSIEKVMQRVTSEPLMSSRADEIFLKLSFSVLQARDDKARREMKALVYRLLKEDKGRIEISKDTLYHLCHRCLSSLILCLSGASSADEKTKDRGGIMGEIGREADNMQWIVEILIDRKMGDEFVKLWADQKELAVLHSKIPIMYRHEVSRITAQLCVSIGKGLVLVGKDVRFALLDTWLEALYDDFSWMRRGGKAFDKKLLEEGLSHTILTLPLCQQQAVLMSWFDRFLSKGDDCPNIQKAFEIWWRRAFVKQYGSNSRLQMTVYDDMP